MVATYKKNIYFDIFEWTYRSTSMKCAGVRKDKRNGSSQRKSWRQIPDAECQITQSKVQGKTHKQIKLASKERGEIFPNENPQNALYLLAKLIVLYHRSFRSQECEFGFKIKRRWNCIFEPRLAVSREAVAIIAVHMNQSSALFSHGL